MNIDFNLNFLSFHRRITLTKREFQYVIVLCTALIAIIATYWGTKQIFVLTMSAVGGLVVILSLMLRPTLGYFLLLLSSCFIPFSGPGGINASMIVVILMVFLWGVDMFIVKRRFGFVHSNPVRPTFYFIVVCVAAFLMGQILWYVTAVQAPLDTQLGGFAIYFFSLAALIMTANIVNDVRWLKGFVWFFISLGALYVLGRAINLAGIDEIFEKGFIANSMFWVWLVAMTLGQLIFNNTLRRSIRIVLLTILIVVFYVAVIINYDWKSGWVPPLMVAGVLLALRFRKLGLLSTPFLLIAFVNLLQKQITLESYSWGTRLDAWRIVLEVSLVNPILGLGFANYYWYVTLFNIRGYYIKFVSHSQYVDLIAQTGFVGLICFIWIMFEVGRLSWSLMHSLKDGFARGYAYSVFAGLIGTVAAAFLVDWVLPFAYNIGLNGFRASILPWIFFGGLIAIEQIHFAKNVKDREGSTLND